MLINCAQLKYVANGYILLFATTLCLYFCLSVIVNLFIHVLFNKCITNQRDLSFSPNYSTKLNCNKTIYILL